MAYTRRVVPVRVRGAWRARMYRIEFRFSKLIFYLCVSHELHRQSVSVHLTRPYNTRKIINHDNHSLHFSLRDTHKSKLVLYLSSVFLCFVSIVSSTCQANVLSPFRVHTNTSAANCNIVALLADIYTIFFSSHAQHIWRLLPFSFFSLSLYCYAIFQFSPGSETFPATIEQ